MVAVAMEMLAPGISCLFLGEGQNCVEAQRVPSSYRIASVQWVVYQWLIAEVVVCCAAD